MYGFMLYSRQLVLALNFKVSTLHFDRKKLDDRGGIQNARRVGELLELSAKQNG